MARVIDFCLGRRLDLSGTLRASAGGGGKFKGSTAIRCRCVEAGALHSRVRDGRTSHGGMGEGQRKKKMHILFGMSLKTGAFLIMDNTHREGHQAIKHGTGQACMHRYRDLEKETAKSLDGAMVIATRVALRLSHVRG